MTPHCTQQYSAPGINGFEYENSTQWQFVRWEAVAAAFPMPLDVDPAGV